MYSYQFEQMCTTEMFIWTTVSVKMCVCINWLSVVVQHKAFALVSAFQPEVYNVEPWQVIMPSISVSLCHVIVFCDLVCIILL